MQPPVRLNNPHGQLERSFPPCAAALSRQQKNRPNPSTLTAHQVSDEVTRNAVRRALTLGDDSRHERLCRGIPFQVDRPVDLRVRAMNLGPARVTSRRLLSRYRQMVPFQTLVVSDGFTEAPTAVTRHLDDALHRLKSFLRALSRGLLSPSFGLPTAQQFPTNAEAQSHRVGPCPRQRFGLIKGANPTYTGVIMVKIIEINKKKECKGKTRIF